MVKERPILFNGAMVRAILDGRKTQTRRVWKMPRGLAWYVSGSMRGEETGDICDPASNWWGHIEEMACPYGDVGDRLYVRETWARLDDYEGIDPGTDALQHRAFYRADHPAGIWSEIDPSKEIRWRPSIHMPRALSRILLEVTSVRVERLNDCGEADARAEGVTIEERHKIGYCSGADRPPSIRAYRDLWDEINGAGAWAANPWVWVVEFRRIAP